MENKNIDALGEFMAAYRDPLGTIKDFDGIVRFMGVINQLTCGINSYAKAEFTPLMESDEKREDDEDHDDVQKPVEDEPYWPSQEEIDN